MTNNRRRLKIWLNLIVLCGLLVATSNAGSISVASEEDPPTIKTATQPSGMPGRPIPARPIPHHEPGQVSRAANASRQVTRRNAAGVEQTIELSGMEALLADGTMSDPLAGNYSIVNLDQILLVRNSDQAVETEAWTAFEEPDVLITPTPIPGSLASVGTTPVGSTPAIAAGDLNGDNMAEQITAWRDYSSALIAMSIGGLPGAQGEFTSNPAVVAHDDGRMDLLARGYDDALWHRHYNGSAWGEWNNTAGGYLMSGPAMASHGNGQFDAFVAGVYNSTTAIYQRHWNGSAWSSGWNLVNVHPTDGVELLDDPAATVSGTNQINLFRRASDNTLRWLHYDGAAWGTWQNLGGLITSAPAAVAWGAGHLQVFAQGFDGALWYIAHDDNGWGEWARQADLTLTSKPAAILLEGLIGHWKLDDGSGTTASDGTGNGHDGTLINDPAWITDTAPTNFDNPYALQFDGTDDAMSAVIDVSERTYALSLWFKTTCGDCGISSVDDGTLGTGANDRHLYLSGGNLCARVWNNEVISTTGVDYADGEWHHVVHTFGGAVGGQKIYVDGTEAASGAKAVSDFTWQTRVTVGFSNDASNYYLDGMIDDVRVYNRTLSTAEIEALAAGDEPTAHQFHIYARGEDAGIWRNSLSGATWSGWESLGGGVIGSAAAAAHDAQIELFVRGLDSKLWHKSYNGAAWGTWQGPDWIKRCCSTHSLGFQSGELALETGYFVGDGREQIVLAYAEGGGYGVRLYDVKDGFTPVLLATPWVTTTAQVVRAFDITTGDLDGDGLDEIGLVVSRSNDDWNWEHDLHILDVNKTGPWALEEVWLEKAPEAANVSDAKYVITSGDFDGNGDDEFATAWSRCGYPFGWWDPWCWVKLSVYESAYDQVEGWNISLQGSATLDSCYKAYPYLDLAAADLDLDPKTRAEEIIYAGPDGKPLTGQTSKGELAVWSANPLTATQQITTTVESFSLLEYPFKMTVGDFNRDLKPEIAFLHHVDTTDNPMNLALYGYDATGDFGALKSFEQAQTPWSASGRFDLAAGDLTGESLRVGPPTYRREKSANNIVAILNTPPTHRDSLDGQEYVIGGDDSYSIYEKGEQSQYSFSHAFSHNWDLGVSVSMGTGDPRGTHVKGGMDLSYGGHFEHAFMESHSVEWNQSVQATTDDALLFSYSDYDIWEYPVYADSDHTPDNYMAVVFPVEGSTGIHISPGNTCQSWYKPTHQVDNLWSYPLDKDDFNGYDPNDSQSHLYQDSITTGGTEYDWYHEMIDHSAWELSHSEYFGLMTDFEFQIGGDEIGCDLVVSGKTRTAFIKVSIRGSYDFKYLGKSDSEITEHTTVKTHIGPVAPDSSYSSESHLFWAEEGYLKLDYTANPEPHAFWNLYDKPDPTFIRPWTDGRCGEDKNDYTRDITIWPFYTNRGETVTISATVRNYSNVSAYNVRVRFYLGDPDDGGRQIGADQIIPTLARAVGPETVSVEWTASGSGLQRIYAVVDPDNELEEMHDEVNNVNNNKGYNLVKIGQADYIDPAMSEEHAYYRLAYGRDSGTRVAADRSSFNAQAQGLTFDAYVAPGNLEEVILFSFTSLDDAPSAPSGMAPIGDVVALEAFQVGNQEEVFDLKPTDSSPPGIITVQYSETDLRGTPEEDLRFYTWTGTEWAEPTCAGHTLLHLTEDNMFVVPICETGTFALFGDEYEVFLPLILK